MRPEELEDLVDEVGEVLSRRGHELAEDGTAELVADTIDVTVTLLEASGRA